MPSGLRVASGCGLALVLTSCASDAPRQDLIPPGPFVTSVEQLSGAYCYFGPEYNLRSFRRSPKMIPFLNVEAFGGPTKVSVEASAERIVFVFTGLGGDETRHVFLPSVFRAAWRENALVVRWSGVGPNVGEMIGLNLLGIVVQGLLGSHNPAVFAGGAGRESRLFRLEDGRLVMTDTFKASGDLKPADQSPGHWAREDAVALLLDPVAGDCAAGPTHPPQPWYDEGVDLGKPACAAQLEDQVVSILVAEGEAQEEARIVAEEKVAALRRGEGGWTGLSVACASGTTYGFRFGKQSPGCVLQMVELAKKRSRTTWSFGYASARVTRPLPACECN